MKHCPKTKKEGSLCDVLMIAHNRPEYLELALPALLESGDETLRVWVWQNEAYQQVTEIIDKHIGHPRLHRVHRSTHNAKLREPTNWLWSESDAPYVGKVDDDTLVPREWLETLRVAHERYRQFGVLGCWVHPETDYDEGAARKKISRFGGVKILENPWMAGSAYLMKRACVQQNGVLSPDDTFPQYCVRLAWDGWINGWLLPLLLAEHMDDPRSPHCILKTQEDFEKFTPLTAKRNGVKTLEEWKELNRISAVEILKGGKKAGRLFWIRRALRRVLALQRARAVA
ncbi:MAG: glycosyltransferase [Chthoniobacterales bacterium]|nr:glycosyltransferase [Chthoniobacterales bacterium]